MDSAAAKVTAPSGTQWTIDRAGHRAVVVEVGGGLRAYGVDGVDVVDGYAEPELCPGAAGQILAPWPNRIRDGRYTFDGHAHQLGLTEPSRHNAIHGLVRWARWRVAATTDTTVTLEHELVPQPGYPWPLLLRSTWSVGPDGLTGEHTATNLGDRPAPFGLAAHPYLRLPEAAVDDLRLRVPAGSRLLSDARLLPIGAARVTGGDYDYTEGRRIGAAVLDVAFGDLERDGDGISTVTLAAPDGRELRLWADEAFGWWQIFTADTLAAPRQRRSVAIEPMTCPPDAFRSGRDVISLEPGETWRGRWGIAPRLS